MLEQFMDYRERQQMRKDRLQKRNMRYLFILFGLLLVIGIAASAVEAVKPEEKPKSSAVTMSVADQQELQKIEEFTEIVTKPVGEVTSEDLALIDTVKNDPCYEKNALVEKELMVDAIAKCKGLK